MMRSSLTVAAAVMIGFVSVLVYRVSASDGPGVGLLPVPAGQVNDALGETPPLKVEFIVQQCDIAGPEALEVASQPDVLDVPADAVPKASLTSPAITDKSVAMEHVPEVVAGEGTGARKGQIIMISPSILYIP